MSLTVAEVLPLEAFQTFKLIAGQEGLHKNIFSVGMLDYEVGEKIEENFIEGELVVTTLVAIKDDLSQLEDMIRRLIKAKTVGFAIKKIYIESVPEAVIQLCNEAAYPLFLFEETFFEVIIKAVNDALKNQIELEDLEFQIDRLLAGDMNKYGVRRAAQTMNRNFQEYIQVAHVNDKPGRPKGQASFLKLGLSHLLDRHHLVIPYHKGYLVVVSSNQSEGSDLSASMQQALIQLGFQTDTVIGYSRERLRMDKLDVAIQESLYASRTAKLYQIDQLRFAQMGLDRMLLPIQDNPWVMSYYESVMEPIIEYDQKNGSDLLRTAVIYILSGGDVKLAAERLFQHGNTVRYRMDRIRQLICQDQESTDQSEWSFYEMLAVGVRLHLIYTGSL